MNRTRSSQTVLLLAWLAGCPINGWSQAAPRPTPSSASPAPAPKTNGVMDPAQKTTPVMNPAHKTAVVVKPALVRQSVAEGKSTLTDTPGNKKLL